MRLSYQEYVNRAKNLLGQIDAYQAKIAQMAMEVCEIRHGGKSDAYYTLTDFANDIGINRKTLSSWVHTYRDVLLKSDIRVPSDKDWSNALLVSRFLKTEREIINKEDNSSGSKKAFKKSIPKERVKEIFTKVSNGEFEEIRIIESIYSTSRYFKNVFGNIDFSKCDRKKLLQIMENLDRVSDAINEYLTASSLSNRSLSNEIQI